MDKMSDAFVSGLITVLLERFLSTETYNLVVGKKLGPQLVRRLRTALLAAEALVSDAEQKQFGNKSVRKWLDDLRDAVYKADDLLDRFCIKAKTQKPVRTFLPSFLNFEERQMVNEIEEVVGTIEDLEKFKESLGLEKIPTGSSSWRTPSSSLVRGNVHGREDDKRALINMLNDNNEHHLSVIAIVGIGGVGKTTLAQWLYNNEEEEFMKGFDLKAWVCVSENFDIVQTTKNVLKEILGGTCSLDEFNSLQHVLKEQLSNKKFFIVLDDVWSDDGDRWSNFITPFQHGKKGSIVLLTTRGENVALAVHQDCRPYFLRGLSEDYCWSVFADNASFPQSNGSAALEEIGRKIVKKCDGLPLAAETLGRLLRAKHDLKEWKKILMSDIWGLPVEKSKIIPALLISYFHLPAYLKHCFVYCSLYPKDYIFKKDELIFLWMAEDLLPPPKGGETLQEVGYECFDELTSRLFFTHPPQYYGDYLLMHDLLHDLAIFLARDFYCNLEKLGEEEEIRIQTRHLRVNLRECSSEFPNSISKVESLRTLLMLGDLSSPNCNIEAATCDILAKCKYLRALSCNKLDVLPDSIGKLIHLRYLNLSWTKIKILPESFCTLSGLLTVKLQGCSKLTTLPSGLHNLVSLQHLDIWDTYLEEMPRKMSKLNQLHILSSFVVGKHEDNGIQELGGLVNLDGSLEIKKLENIVNVKAAKGAKMMDKKHLDKLCLEWSSGDDMVSSTQTERDMLDSLQPHYSLNKLAIGGYKGTIFPDWVGHRSYQNMTSVSLKSCENCCMMPSLGQLPSLKTLRIRGFHQLKRIGMEFYKNEGDQHSLHIAPFPSLETLEFHDMPSWEVWHVSEFETFPRLSSLRISDCGILKGEILNQVLLRIISSLAYVSKICKVDINSDHADLYMFVEGDSLSISGCDSLKESAFTAMSSNHLTCLQEIQISDYMCDISFPGNCLPKSLLTLTIWSCGKLEFPEQQQHKYNLVSLAMHYRCDSLTSLSLDAFPNIKHIFINACSNLQSISMSEPHHTALQSLTIYDCPKFESFSGEGLVAPNLTHLHVGEFSKMKALPSDLRSLFPNLQSLNITGCQKIYRLPKGDLLPNLKELHVGGCDKQLRGLSSMVNFDTLTHLTISGYGCQSIIKSYPEVGSMPHLPSLSSLEISFLLNLETLECNELLRLTSLQHLHILCCDKLENMAGEKLPSSLLTLKISHCHLLGEQCQNKHIKIWPKISHIPTIQVLWPKDFLNSDF
ncbi:hypothetical protein PIB30_085843 [Stylosanthes scabra]|uniref:Disease resistance RPP13-like protein 1 n=1 Tax=Stylosanthes scabra TaxID=79078 RepID=A0ABU6SU34_9FABA|nr:hypothetical protein [Stylosanthes scabra]